MSGQRVSWEAAERLADQLSDRDRAIINSLNECRVLTGQQLDRLHFVGLSTHTHQRIRRRVLKRLTDWHVVARLDRTIGGVRAGSTGWVYSLGVAGQRLMQLDANQRGKRIRAPWTPGMLFLKHSLDVAELYVQLVEVSRGGSLMLASFQTEPACWWPDGLGGFVKPDAFLVLSTARYDELVWLEVDRGTESLPTLKRKLSTYSDFVRRGQLGPSGVMPHVVVSTLTEQRAEAVGEIIEAVEPTGELFRVTTFEQATKQLIALASAIPEEPP